MKNLIFTFLFFGLFSCQPSNNPVLQETEKLSKSDSIISKAIEVYGMQNLDKANLEFTFKEAVRLVKEAFGMMSLLLISEREKR